MSSKKYTVNSVGPRIGEFLKPVLEMARLRVTFEVTEPEARFANFENPDILVDFEGPDIDLLLANKGELLLALEHLSMEAIQLSPRDHSLVIFDANESRMMRIEELRLSAITAAEKVLASNRPFHFSPMTSRERRIIHLATREVKEVRSESAGVGPGRGVVIYPADMPSQPAAPSSHAGPPHRRRRR